MSDGHILVNTFWRPAAARPSFLTLLPFLLFLPSYTFDLPRRAVFFLAGDLTQWHLPVGMKDLILGGTKVTGKATSE